MNVIEFNNVWKKFNKGEKFNSLRDAIPGMFRSSLSGNGLKKNEFWALENVSFQMEKGDVLGIIGPNGAGKSTILKLLSKVMSSNKGEISIKGRISALIEVAAGFHPDLTGKENIYLNGTILGMRKKEIDRKFDQIVEFSGISEFINMPVKRYSSGMYARLGFSVAVHVDPDILLVDEVLAVGDMAFQAKCVQKMKELLSSRVTIVIVSHNLSLVQNLCKRVILLNKGQVYRDGAPEEIMLHYQELVNNTKIKEMKHASPADGYLVRHGDEIKIKIDYIKTYDKNAQQNDVFSIHDKIKIEIRFIATEKVISPVFSIDIVRSDGVLCCLSNTKNDNFKLDMVESTGIINAEVGNLNLSPGIYTLRVAIWDKDMLHPLTINNSTIIRIGSSEHSALVTNPVFTTSFKWF